MSHTVTSKIKKELSKFAERITPPDTSATRSKGLTGAELRDQYGLTVDTKGKPLQPLQRYFLKDLPRVNHLRRLCKAYEAGAWPQVELYLQRYRTPERIAKDAQAAAAAQVAPAPEYHPLAAKLVDEHGHEKAVAQIFINGNKLGDAFEVSTEQLQLSRGGRGAGSTYARRSLASMVHTGTITINAEDAAALMELTAEVQASPAVFEPLPEVAADAVATELQVSRPVPEVREFTKLCQRWEAEADAAQQLSAGGRGAGSTYARHPIDEALAAGLHYPAAEGAVATGPLYVAGYSDEVGAPLAVWLDEAGPLQHVPTAAQRLAAAYEAGVAVPPLKLWRDYRREICGAEWMQGCTQPCGEHCPMLGHRCTPESFAENQKAADAEAAA